MNNDKPIGTYRCAACDSLWDGNETYRDPQSLAQILTCGNLLCGASVRRISDLPKTEYMARLENKVGNAFLLKNTV